jgi:hypothetical protein
MQTKNADMVRHLVCRYPGTSLSGESYLIVPSPPSMLSKGLKRGT